MKPDALVRMILSAVLMALVCLTFDTGFELHWFFARGGWPAYMSLCTLTALSITAMVDVLFNDLCPREIRARRCKQCRHLIWMGIAITCCAYVWIMVKAGGHAAGILTFGALGLASCRIAFYDAHLNRQSARRGEDR